MISAAFWPMRALEGMARPWIVVGGDEASKVWLLKPRQPLDSASWDYDSAVIFDINDYYGAGTTQTLMKEPRGISISTIGGLAWRYDESGPLGMAEFYFPVFEARDIHVIGFRPAGDRTPLACPPDVRVACPE